MSMECRQLNVGNLESCARDFSESGKQPPGSARIWSGPEIAIPDWQAVKPTKIRLPDCCHWQARTLCPMLTMSLLKCPPFTGHSTVYSMYVERSLI
jgi:hypothetical protein